MKEAFLTVVSLSFLGYGLHFTANFKRDLTSFTDYRSMIWTKPLRLQQIQCATPFAERSVLIEWKEEGGWLDICLHDANRPQVTERYWRLNVSRKYVILGLTLSKTHLSTTILR